MKFSYITTALITAIPAIAQSIQIGNPAPFSNLVIGQPFTVEVDKPDSISPSTSVSVAIGLQRCGPNPCPVSENDQVLGEIVFQGDYVPVRHQNQPQKPPYQNFTFELSADEKSQSAVIHVAHFFLVGAGPTPLLETRNVSVTIVQGGGAKGRRMGL